MLYLLYESPLGLALFKKKEYDELAADTKQVLKAIKSLADFGKMVKLKAFTVFPNQETSVEVLKALLEGKITPFLQEFLETYYPSGKKNLLLAVQDVRLAKNLSTNLSIKCTNNDTCFELFRGIRTHFDSYIKGKIDSGFVSLTQACLGMSHTLSRNLIKFDPKRNDKSIIQSYSLVDQMDKNLNTFSMRLKEWYGWHFPELVKIVPDNEVYTQVAHYIGNRESLTEDSIPELEEFVTDGELAQKIYDSSLISVGSDLNEVDEQCMKAFCSYLVSHFDYKKKLLSFMKQKMDHVTPNLCTLIGETMGAKLMTHAGGLANLSKLPASTIQILGAEKALFRALKKKGSTPKYGFLYNCTFISRAEGRNKGKISRFLANKLSLAARLDMHLLKPTNKFGERMRDQVEARLQQLKAGGEIEKNERVLEAVVDELEADGIYIHTLEKRKPKKSKKSKKSKKNKKKVEEEEEDAMDEEEAPAPKKKKKKSKKSKKKVEEEEEEVEEAEEKPKKKKKKKKKSKKQE